MAPLPELDPVATARAALTDFIRASKLEPSVMALVLIRTTQLMEHKKYGPPPAPQDTSAPACGSFIAEWKASTLLTERERAALQWVEVLNEAVPCGLLDEVWRTVSPHWTPTELKELTLLVSTTKNWSCCARLLNPFNRIADS